MHCVACWFHVSALAVPSFEQIPACRRACLSSGSEAAPGGGTILRGSEAALSVDTIALVTIALATDAPVGHVDALVPKRVHLPHPESAPAAHRARGGARPCQEAGRGFTARSCCTPRFQSVTHTVMSPMHWSLLVTPPETPAGSHHSAPVQSILDPRRPQRTHVNHCGPMPTTADPCRPMRTRADQCGVG